ncbi:MAG: sigma-E factor regulatory protein RseB domain-containing protein [Mycobacteriales bacterium]
MKVRLLVLVTGLGALMSGVPVLARVDPPTPADDGPVAARSAPALALLQQAARAARTRAWSGTQQVVTMRDGKPVSTVLEVRHTPGTGSTVRVLSPASGAAAVADVLDDRLLGLLADHYDLRVGGRVRCAGYSARLVEALRPGRAHAVAARFWLDTTTGLVLRRDVLDTTGDLARSSAFVDLQVRPTAAVAQPLVAVVHPTGEHLDGPALDALSDQGWPLPRLLPAGLELFEARMHEGGSGEVLQLSYSDGLSTLSLFVQPGVLPSGLSAGQPPGDRQGSPERVVWSGAGRTWTLVSDAPQEVVDAAVAALPHEQPPAAHDGVLARAWRGMSRVGAWLNPFD